MSSNRRASLPVNTLRRSPRRRTKTPSVNELWKKFKISPRGKRKLEFQHDKPLKGRTYYLDLQGYRKTSSLQAQIKELGGAVEEFLSKDISCVVTNRKDADTRCSPRSNSTPSPILSIPSPFPGNAKSSSAKGSAVPSPLSADSGGPEQAGSAAPKHNIRGKALAAQAAVTCQYGTSNIIANARNWGLEIMQLEEMLEKLGKYGSIEKKPTSKPLVSGRVVKQGVKPKVRKLYAPFIKVEDHSRCYKPLVHELKEWPKIHFDGPLGSCPFDSPKGDKENDLDQRDRTKRKPLQEDKNKKKGFCECCCVHYEDLDLHLHSDRHQSFARDSSNYRSLDELINKGPSLQDFLAKMLRKHEQKEKEKQEKSRKEKSSPAESYVGHDEQKTPPKQNGKEILPNCQTPVNRTPSKDADRHTPTSPSQGGKGSCHTPTTHSSPAKNSADAATPTRMLRSRGGKGANDVKPVGSRELRSSPRTPSASKENSSPGKQLSTKPTAHAKTRSTSSSPIAACSPRGKGASLNKEQLISQSPGRTRSEVGKKKSPVGEKKVNIEESRQGLRKRRSHQDSSDESSSKENYDPESLVDSHAKETKEFEVHVERSKLRSGTTLGGQQPCDKDEAENKNRVESQGDVQDDSELELDKGSPRRSSLRSASKMSPESCAQQLRDKDEDENPVESQNGEQEVFEQGKGNPRRSSLRSASKMSPAQELKNSESPKKDEETSLSEDKLERNTRSRTQSSITTEQSSDDDTSASESKASEMSLSDQQVTMETDPVNNVPRLTRSQVQSAPTSVAQKFDDPNEGPKTASDVSSPVTQASAGEEEQEFQAEKRRTSSRLRDVERGRDTLSSQEDTKEAVKATDKSETTSQVQSPKRLTRGDAVADMTVKLSDCRRMCEDRKRPVLERESSDESETESIQLSSGENISPSKDASSNKTSSEEEDEEVSSTPTLNHCPSSPNSEKSGYSDETSGYSLRKCVDQQEEEPGVSKRTRSNYKIPDEASRRNTVPSPYTSVKSRSPKQRSQSVKSPKSNTPVKKKHKSSGTAKSPLNNTSRGKGLKEKEPASESDSSTFSGSPRSGPIRETRNRRALTRSAVQCLKEDDDLPPSTPLEDTEDARRPMPFSDTTASLGDVSTIAVCGTPRHMNPADYNLAGDYPKRNEASLSGTGHSNEQKLQTPVFIAKERKPHRGIARLFDSDDEDEEFYGFNVPQFDGSFSSEGDLSFKINSIVESIKDGDSSQATLDDADNTTIQAIDEEDTDDEVRQSAQENTKTAIKAREIIMEEYTDERTEKYNETKPPEDTRKTRKRKSTSQIAAETKRAKSDSQDEGRSFSESFVRVSSVIDDRSRIAAETKRAKLVSQDEGRSFSESYMKVSSVIDDSDDDVDEDDDVFSTVSDSSDGEEEAVGSPFSVTSWRQKRKSEELQPEVDRPRKRLKSHEQWSVQMDTVPSTLSSKSETPVKSGAVHGTRSQSEGGEKPASFTSKLDEMLQEQKRDRFPSFSSIEGSCEFYDSDEPVVQTLEERVKLRRIRKISRKANENSAWSAQNRKSNTQESQTKSATSSSAATKKRELRKTILPLKPLKNVSPIPPPSKKVVLPLKPYVSPIQASSKKTVLPLKPLKHISPIQGSSRKALLPLKPLKHVSPFRTSSRLNRANSSPSSNQSPLAAPSGKSRRTTWFFDDTEFSSPPTAVPSFGGKRVTCSPASVHPSKDSLRSRRSDKTASRNSRERDAFAFDVGEVASPPSGVATFGGKRVTCSTPATVKPKHSLRSQGRHSSHLTSVFNN